MAKSIKRYSKNPFADAVKLAESANIKLRTAQSLAWYRKHVSKSLTHISSWNAVSRTGEASVARSISPGSIYTFIYSPKHKNTLPYYDATPLVIPFQDEGKTFLAFNLHYLPMSTRAIVMDMLFKINQGGGTDNQKMTAKYNVIMSMNKSNLFKPCVKRYLKSHVRSQFLEFKPEHWELSIFLPIANFQKASSSQVHADSMNRIISKKKRK